MRVIAILESCPREITPIIIVFYDPKKQLFNYITGTSICN